MTVPAQLAAWHNAMWTDSYAPNTIARRIKSLDRVVRHNQLEHPNEITEDHVRSLLGDRDYAPWTVIAYLRDIEAYAKWAKIDDPTKNIRRPRQPRPVPRPLPEPALMTLLHHVRHDSLLYAWVVLGAFLGFRASETANARAEDFDQWAKTVTFKGKGGVEAILPLSPIVLQALDPFLTRRRGRLWDGVDPEDVSQQVAIAAAQVGVHMRYHQCRHRFGTAVYRATHDLLVTQQLMRHSDPATTAGYAQAADDGAQAAVDMLPGAQLPTTETDDDQDDDGDLIGALA